MDVDHAEALSLLCYPPQWAAYGLPSPRLLAQQLETFRSGVDSSTEHYRFAAFKTLLGEGPLSDEQVTQYLTLVEADPDSFMARSALIELLLHPDLTDAQFERLSQHPWMLAYPKPAKCERLLRLLRREGPTEAALERCVSEGDAGVHHALLRLPALPTHILERLAQSGGSRFVRNVAGAQLRTKKR
jgi:hypothetical protein